ncbi:MAG: glycoside hydrolase family 3 protein [Terracidiphilus sp.]|nr:glycoside hydrolase family 3 protein [Terracidiphilus sp.]
MRRGQTVLLALMVAAMTAPCASAAPPVHLDRKGEHWAQTTLRKMTLEEKVGQMMMVWAKVQFLNPESPEFLELRDELTKYHVGGFGVTVATEGSQLIMSEPLEAAALTNRLQKDSKYPLLIAADFERGLSMRLEGATAFPAAMAFGATGDKNLAREFGRISARESRAIGVEWNWFPIADVNSNPANPIIDTRSFGEDPVLVSEMVAAYIEGARSEGLLTTAKHFPGHGDTDTDSHLTLARVPASMDRLNSVELVPFRSAIAAGVDSIMVGHLIVPAVEPDPNRPASVSAHVIKDLLEGQLHFKGLVVTDGMDMAGLTHVFAGSEADISREAAVAAVKAGEDVVILPGDLGAAFNGLLQAVKSGEISQARINQSVLKILRAKASVGLNEKRLVNLSNVEDEVARPDDVAFAQSVADRAVTLVVDKNRLIPLAASTAAKPERPASRIVAVIFSDRPRGSDGGRAFASEVRKRAPEATVFFVDPSNASYVFDSVMGAVHEAGSVIAVAESVPNPRRTTEGRAGGSAGLEKGPMQLLTEMVKTAAAKTIVVAFGNPYTGGSISGIQTYVCTYSNTVVSASSLARALFGEIPIHGRLPVSIPNLAPRGTGLDRDAIAARASAP